MTKDDAIAFLRANQPLRGGYDATQEDIDRYGEVLDWFREHRDHDLIPWVFGSFSEGDGFGIHDGFYQVLKGFADDQLVDHIQVAFKSRIESVRRAAAEFCGQRPIAALFDDLLKLARSDPEDEVRTWAVMAIIGYKRPGVEDLLREIGERDFHPAVKDTVDMVLRRRARTRERKTKENQSAE